MFAIADIKPFIQVIRFNLFFCAVNVRVNDVSVAVCCFNGFHVLPLVIGLCLPIPKYTSICAHCAHLFCQVMIFVSICVSTKTDEGVTKRVSR
jgi:hypothetical protein